MSGSPRTVTDLRHLIESAVSEGSDHMLDCGDQFYLPGQEGQKFQSRDEFRQELDREMERAGERLGEERREAMDGLYSDVQNRTIPPHLPLDLSKEDCEYLAAKGKADGATTTFEGVELS